MEMITESTWKKTCSANVSSLRRARVSGKDSNVVAHKQVPFNLPSTYTGMPDRIGHYAQYNVMANDPVIKKALLIYSTACTQEDEDTNLPFVIDYLDKMSSAEVEVIETKLYNWVKLNDFDIRIPDIVKRTLQYGDYFCVRDPETFELHYVDPADIEKINLDENGGKEPSNYHIRNLSLNVACKVATPVSSSTSDQSSSLYNPTGIMPSGTTMTYNGQGYQESSGNGTDRFSTSSNAIVVDATHVVHISLNTGLDLYWPFGRSILEDVWVKYKQKQLLEDAILIYRITRAPERRVFKINVGQNVNEHKVMAIVERFKNELNQKKIPAKNSRGGSVVDSQYNPQSMTEDFYMPVFADGSGPSIETLPGGENLGQIDDLKYFNDALTRAFVIPSAYMNAGPENSGHLYNDGRVGTALQEEELFNKECKKYQRIIAKRLDKEFKLYLKQTNTNVDSSSFQLNFMPPLNFAAYRMNELLQSKIGVCSSLMGLPFMSAQMAIKMSGLMSVKQMRENEKLKLEEQSSGKYSPSDMPTDMGGGDLGGLEMGGIQPSGIPETDLEDFGEIGGGTGGIGEEPTGSLEEPTPEQTGAETGSINIAEPPK